MKVVGVSMMRDEADVAFHVVRHLLDQGVDHVIVADNRSTDGTGDLCRDAGATVLLDPVPGYYQSAKMNQLARRAAEEHGAEWIVPFDADELWDIPHLDVVAQSADVIRVPAYDFLPRRDDPAEPNPFKRMQWRRDHPQPFPKVTFRWHPRADLAMGNHSVSHPSVRVVGAPSGLLRIRHFQYRTPEQMARKTRQGTEAYSHTTMPASEGAHWRRLAAMSDDQLNEQWEALLAEPDLVWDPA